MKLLKMIKLHLEIIDDNCITEKKLLRLRQMTHHIETNKWAIKQEYLKFRLETTNQLEIIREENYWKAF